MTKDRIIKMMQDASIDNGDQSKALHESEFEAIAEEIAKDTQDLVNLINAMNNLIELKTGDFYSHYAPFYVELKRVINKIN